MSEKSKQNPNQKMRVKFITLGCKVNQYETQALREEFAKRGWECSDTEADLCVVNTCTVTHRADVKSKEAILKAKRQNPGAKIAVCGCLVQYNKDLIRSLGVDYLIPQDKKHLLIDIISGTPSVAQDIWSLQIHTFLHHRAFIKIQDGCDRFCAFCKIPYLRGSSRSRVKSEIIEEVKRLSQSHYEVVLCGINIGLYGKDLSPRSSLYGLVSQILAIDTLGRVRLSSIEPYLISDPLLSLFKNKKMCPHLHLPFQSGDDTILGQMNKKETTALYRHLVHKARTVNPSLAISCDIMVGFPYEQEHHFKNTCAFLEDVRPMRMHIFRFSPREKTKFESTRLRNNAVVKKRSAVLKELETLFALEYKKKFLGKQLHMIAEEREGGYTFGYTENYLRTYVKEDIPLGTFCPVQGCAIEQGKIIAKRL